MCNSTDTVSATGTNSNSKGSASTIPIEGISGPTGEEMTDQRPKIISPELRALLSRKVEVLPRKIVRKEGEGLNMLKKPGMAHVR
jgi:hypothetical protein